jgi:hypothetical protein
MQQLLAHCASPAWPLRASARGVFFVVGKNYRLQDIQLSKNAWFFEASGCQHSAATLRSTACAVSLSPISCEASGAFPLQPTF